MRTYQFTVAGLPPKKDGAYSMWNKPSEVERIRLLRHAAAKALNGDPPLAKNIRLTLRAHVGAANTRMVGDLDNFLTGICDGLQSVHPGTPLLHEFDEIIHPSLSVAIEGDVEVTRIDAEKVVGPVDAPYYEITLEGE